MQDGYLRIDVVNSENNFPIKGAEASISYGESGQTQEVLRTNLSGQTEEIAVAAPPALLSLKNRTGKSRMRIIRWKCGQRAMGR